MSKKPKPHGPVSERFMRQHYGASGYVPPAEPLEAEGLEALVAKWRRKVCLDEGTCSCHEDCADELEAALARARQVPLDAANIIGLLKSCIGDCVDEIQHEKIRLKLWSAVEMLYKLRASQAGEARQVPLTPETKAPHEWGTCRDASDRLLCTYCANHVPGASQAGEQPTLEPMEGITDDDMEALEEIIAERHGRASRGAEGERLREALRKFAKTLHRWSAISRGDIQLEIYHAIEDEFKQVEEALAAPATPTAPSEGEK